MKSFRRAVAALLVLVASSSLASDKVTVGRNWSVNQQTSANAADHTTWQRLLTRYVDQRGYVDYAAWKSDNADMRSLDQYLAELSKSNPKLTATHNARLAYWINAYNAVTVKGILREYPTTSIKNHVAHIWGYNIWDDLQLVTPTGQLSLNQMEHDILRKMGDPRIHFAIVCASKGCPRLLNDAYTLDKVDKQLTSNAKEFFTDTRRFNYDAQTGTLNVSPILKWFAEDFGSNQQQRLAAIADYLPDATAQNIATSGKARVHYLGYDWSINAQVQRTARP
ncbi:MAG: DUF547 domain-containing protein [Planctomycetales bacterium]